MRLRPLAQSLLFLAPALWLCACTSQLTTEAETAPTSLTRFAFLSERLDESDATPLGAIHWIHRRAEARVPVFDTGTPVERAIMTLHQWDLEPIVHRTSLIVKEGPSRHNLPPIGSRFVIYGYQDGLINVGPLYEDEMVGVFISGGLHRLDYELLQRLDDVSPLSAQSLNRMAWELATYHNESRRAPSVALELALRANELSGWANSDHLDTLAAAYAATGEFKQAAIHQQWAISLAEDADEFMRRRLELYVGGEAYAQARDPSSTLDPEIEELYARAKEGDPTAQFEFALQCYWNQWDTVDEIENPGKHFLTLAAQQGEFGAIEEIGYSLLHGENGWDADPEEGRIWLERAVEGGGSLPAYNLGMMYRDGVGVARDEVLATHWLTIAADRGLHEAAVEVGYRYLEGVGTAASPETADKYFESAAAGGIGPVETMYGERLFPCEEFINETAEEDLPRLNIGPRDFPGLLVSAVNNMKVELERGDPYVTVRLPTSHVGWERQDAPTAMFLLARTAALFGSRDGQEMLADLYESGSGVAVSEEEARYWRARAANNRSGL